MKTPDSNSRQKSHNERSKSKQHSEDAASLNLDDYPIEVLEAVLRILKAQQGEEQTRTRKA